jgi:hypothetical protein
MDTARKFFPVNPKPPVSKSTISAQSGFSEVRAFENGHRHYRLTK